MKYQKGDIVKIIGNTSNHCFEIGDKVLIHKVKEKDPEKQYYVGKSLSDNKSKWSVVDLDLVLVKKDNNCCKPHITSAELVLISELDKYASHPSGIIVNNQTIKELIRGRMLEYRATIVREGVYRCGYYFNNIRVFISEDHNLGDEIIVL